MTNTKNPTTECDGCSNEVVLDGENDGTLIGGDCGFCGYYVTRYVSEFDADEARNATIYDYLDNGGSVYDDIRDMSMDDMEDYFGDMDPAEFL